MGRPARLAALLAVAWLGSTSARPGERPPLPYRLLVTVVWGNPVGPESFRAALASEVSTQLAIERCFRSIGSGPPEPAGEDDLELRIVIDAYHEETAFNYALSDLASSGAGQVRPSVAILEASFELETRLRAVATPLRRSAFRERSSWRPLAAEDPRERARNQLVESSSRSARKFACKGSAAKWAKEIADARASAALTP